MPGGAAEILRHRPNLTGMAMHSTPRAERRGLSVPLVLSVVAALAAATVLAYAPAAQWLAAYNQSLVISEHNLAVANADPGPAEQIALARAYNDALSAGAVLTAGSPVPTGSGPEANSEFEYSSLLSSDTGVMTRIQIPAIDVDLPVYHGTDEATLLRGAGHLNGTSLPVGGDDTRAVITAHRGLPDATMFSDLDRVRVGDLFTVTTLGDVLTYRVIDARIVDPDDTETLRYEPGRDLVTLVTCTPLGINSHRILVTGERETPTPPASLAAGMADPAGPGFPWWAVLYLSALVVVGAGARWVGRMPGR